MKKKIFGVALIAAMALAAGWNLKKRKNEVELSDLALANVEALARYEGQNDRCTEFSSFRCISNGVVYDQMYPSAGL